MDDRNLNDGHLRDPADRDDNVAGNLIGEAVGGVSGIATGMALGSLGGPIGAVIGGLAGAIGGWWSGRAISEAAHHYTEADDSLYRSQYEGSSGRLADRSYDDVRPAYQLGHLAAHNPDYSGRSFDEVETDLRRGWTDDVRSRHGEWDSVRPYARDAYERGRGGPGAAGAGAAAAGAYGAGRTAHSAHEIGRDVSRGLENAWDETKDATRKTGDRVTDGADDLKDRVDGDPSTRPGRDATDRPGR